MALRLGLLATVTAALGWLSACSGQSGTEKGDGGLDSCIVADELDFDIEGLLAQLTGRFAGQNDLGALSLAVHAGAPAATCDRADPAYTVPIRVDLFGEAGVDEAFSTHALVHDPEYVALDFARPEALASSTWRDPAMDAASDVRYTFALHFEDPGWSVTVGWQGGDSGGELGTWSLLPE